MWSEWKSRRCRRRYVVDVVCAKDKTTTRTFRDGQKDAAKSNKRLIRYAQRSKC